jgi:transglutaminase-like putative cysteine protease
MDFSAWFEAYLGDRWHTFDARHNVPRVGRILMARGRDAADVALLTSFGSSTLEHFSVWCSEVGDEALLPVNDQGPPTSAKRANVQSAPQEAR